MLAFLVYLFDTAAPGLSRLAMWSLIVGALTPPLIAFVQQPRWVGNMAWVRSAVMIAAAVIDGVVIALLQGQLTLTRFADSALICGVAIITAYHGIWKPSGIAPTIERKTST